jgi:alkaline phosphatase
MDRIMRRSTLSLALMAALLGGCVTPASVVRDSPAAALPSGAPPPGAEAGAPAWQAAGAAAAAARLGTPARARNLVLLLGDGMGPTTVSAARILRGQLQGGRGEESMLRFEGFPATALSKTYAVDSQTPDSAATMTAIASGAKTNNGVLGLDAGVRRGACAGVDAARMDSLLDLAERAGLATGIVTSTRITHATPAAMYAHSPERKWESDALIPESAQAAGCVDIARQLVDYAEGDGIEVLLGGGLAHFLPAGKALPLPGEPQARGLRGDGADLLQRWQQRHPEGRIIHDAQGLEDGSERGALLGLFAADHLDYELDRQRRSPAQPSLASLTQAAIRRLQADGRPFLLLVEGGRIDHAHHEGRAARALHETLALDDALGMVLAATDPRDTLVVVTADHSHTLSFAGYPQRGNPILGLVRKVGGELARDLHGQPYTTLGYANGPGAPPLAEALEQVDTTAHDYRQIASVPLESETHGGEDVAVYASGPGSEGFRGVMEQHVLFHLMRRALAHLQVATPPTAP